MATLSLACYKVSTNTDKAVVVVTPTPPQADRPDQVAISLFEAARYTNWTRLPGLCLPDGTSEPSAMEICNVGKIAGDKRTLFRTEFLQGGVDGMAAIDGENAKITIKYAKKLTKTAELSLKKVDGRWYLFSFTPK